MKQFFILIAHHYLLSNLSTGTGRKINACIQFRIKGFLHNFIKTLAVYSHLVFRAAQIESGYLIVDSCIFTCSLLLFHLHPLRSCNQQIDFTISKSQISSSVFSLAQHTHDSSILTLVQFFCDYYSDRRCSLIHRHPFA